MSAPRFRHLALRPLVLTVSLLCCPSLWAVEHAPRVAGGRSVPVKGQVLSERTQPPGPTVSAAREVPAPADWQDLPPVESGPKTAPTPRLSKAEPAAVPAVVSTSTPAVEAPAVTPVKASAKTAGATATTATAVLKGGARAAGAAAHGVAKQGAGARTKTKVATEAGQGPQGRIRPAAKLAVAPSGKRASAQPSTQASTPAAKRQGSAQLPRGLAQGHGVAARAPKVAAKGGPKATPQVASNVVPKLAKSPAQQTAQPRTRQQAARQASKLATKRSSPQRAATQPAATQRMPQRVAQQVPQSTRKSPLRPVPASAQAKALPKRQGLAKAQVKASSHNPAKPRQAAARTALPSSRKHAMRQG